MAAVAFQLSDRPYGLSANQAQFLAGMLRRRLTVPEPVEDLADQIWAQSMLNPDAEPSRDIILTNEQMRELHDTMTKVRPPQGEDTAAWDELTQALARDLAA